MSEYRNDTCEDIYEYDEARKEYVWVSNDCIEDLDRKQDLEDYLRDYL